ncbi:unnamed protein product [Brassicogethes aeneus]|uniref:Spatacsin C-terminal domain-containing protein n=1 Tax=Brassicogethes aeneus TaxID=1431903 RepID=A0A9P0FFT8_BRAAE|nr:unnamed protein product [Brassicogethes aeneus]
MQSPFRRPQEYMNPVPPPTLTKEDIAVWQGWCLKGDREVAREAAAKGRHLHLVIVFLTLKKKVKADEAKKWFESEVLLWVDELLTRKQIFKACHILNNIKLDPNGELEKIFYSTNNKDLRDYIGNHLVKNEKLGDDLVSLWHLLELILKNNILISKFKLPEESLKCLDGQEESWKNEIAAKLFLRTQDMQLCTYFSAESFWRQLIVYNDTKLLKTWINVRFNSPKDSYNVSDNLLAMFKAFSLSNEMLNLLNNKITSPNTSETILNEFSKFGIFSEADSKQFLNILIRLNKCDNVEHIYDILRKTHSNISINNFLILLHDYCVENDLFYVFNVCVEGFDLQGVWEQRKSKQLGVILNSRMLIDDFNEDLLCCNIIKVSEFLSQDLGDNYVLMLALIIFGKDVKFEDIFANKILNICGVPLYEAAEKVFNNLGLLKTIYHKRCRKVANTLTYYDLLENNLQVDIKDLFKFRFSNEVIPNFTFNNIDKKYFYTKTVNYLFYLKQGRPFAASQYFANSCDLICKNKVVSKTFKLAVKNLSNSEVTSSCVAFLEIIGENSDILRVSLEAANILTGDYDESEVMGLFLGLPNDAYNVLLKLEDLILDGINFKDFSENDVFVGSIKSYEIVFKFAEVYNLKYPEGFLKNCATRNMWLPFLIFAQIKNYPIDQIKSCLQSLKNPNLLEHVIHSVSHDIQIEDSNALMRERDSRKYFLSRIGVRKSVDNPSVSDSVYSSMTSQSSVGSGASSTGSDFLEIDIVNTKATLLQTLIRCHNSTDPPRALLQACQLYRNPLLAILATSYEPDSLHTNWLTWLAVSTDMYQTFTNFEAVALCSQSVTTLLYSAMVNQYPKTLLQSFEIFLPDSPLRYFLEFLNSCINMNLDAFYLESKLTAFSSSMMKCRRNSVLTETDHEMTYLKNRLWLEDTALHLLCSTLQYNCKSLNQEIAILKVLCKLKVNKYFSIDFPNIENLCRILCLVNDGKCNVKFDVSLMLTMAESRKAVVDCINKLLSLNQFETALTISEIESLPVDIILIKKWQWNFKNKDVNDGDFWERCNKDMLKHDVTADCVINFYLGCYKTVNNNLEKYLITKYSSEWAGKFDLSNQYAIETERWLSFMNLEEKLKNYDDLNVVSHHLLYKEMLEKVVQITPYSETLDKDNQGNLNRMLVESLNRSNFWLALKLEKMFGCSSADLEILKLCFSLAEGAVLPYQLNTQQRLLVVTKGANFRRLSNRKTFWSERFFKFCSHSPGTQQSDNLEAPFQDTLAVLHSLTEQLTNGAEMAYNVFMSYRISINIEIPYQVFVLNTDYMKMLKDALEDDCMNKLEVVHDFIGVFKWSKEEVSDLICGEIVQATANYIRTKQEVFTMWDLNVNENYHLILQLMQDNCSILGHKIYSYASALHKVQITAPREVQVKISELALVIELLILSHNCFTTDCNMEGISIILKKCQSVISNLLTLRSWKLIVRLLTGVARYTEMSYVFQILRENDQFEFLLRKGSRKDSALKIALLEYLKKYCPENRELYKIVALHFTLFSEVAHLWEREAQSVIKNLIEISKMEMQNSKLNPELEAFILLSNTESTKICLNKAIENYTHATEFHLQGEKLAKAMSSAKQVELLALQMSLLNKLPINGSTNCILNLGTPQIIALISNYLNFDQTFILTQAYNYQPDWSTVLYEQCILKRNITYLEHYLNHLALTETIVYNISRKFLSANINTPLELRCMKNVLSKLPSVHTKYRIASELGFTDLVEDLLADGQLAYLKDTVWKKGYKT